GPAQQAANVPRIGFLLHLAPEPSTEVDAFRQGLRELGYIEGQNIVIEYRFASGHVERLPELAAELVRLKPDVIVTPTTPASVAAKQATSTIPIVFAAVADAVGAGLVANLTRPGGNITTTATRVARRKTRLGLAPVLPIEHWRLSGLSCAEYLFSVQPVWRCVAFHVRRGRAQNGNSLRQ